MAVLNIQQIVNHPNQSSFDVRVEVGDGLWFPRERVSVYSMLPLELQPFIQSVEDGFVVVVNVFLELHSQDPPLLHRHGLYLSEIDLLELLEDMAG